MKPIYHKFKAKMTERDGMKFPSKKEAAYYNSLKLFQKSGKLLFFLRQVPIFLPGNVRVVVDFVEFWADGTVNFIDVKGCKTPQYKRNKKLVEALYPIEIIEK